MVAGGISLTVETHATAALAQEFIILYLFRREDPVAWCTKQMRLLRIYDEDAPNLNQNQKPNQSLNGSSGIKVFIQ